MDDLISRQAAIDELKNMYHAAEKWGAEATENDIKARAESCMASLVEMKLRIEKMPSAEPERKIGRWVAQYDEEDYPLGVKCSECGTAYVMPDGWAKYCPNCGAKMEDEE